MTHSFKKTPNVALTLFGVLLIVSLIYTRMDGTPRETHQAASSAVPVIGQNTLIVKDRRIAVEVVDTPETMERGLGGREALSPDEGMLFIFPEEEKHTFWMKDMLFAIDILWISEDGRIVDMRENVSPDTYPETFTPSSPALYVLELPAGYAQEYGVRVGDRVGL